MIGDESSGGMTIILSWNSAMTSAVVVEVAKLVEDRFIENGGTWETRATKPWWKFW